MRSPQEESNASRLMGNTKLVYSVMIVVKGYRAWDAHYNLHALELSLLTTDVLGNFLSRRFCMW